MFSKLLITTTLTALPAVALAGGAVPVTTHIVPKTSSASDRSSIDDAASRALLNRVATAQREITRVINDLRNEFEQSQELREARSALRTAQSNYADAVNMALAPLHASSAYKEAAERVLTLERKLAWGYIDDHLTDWQRDDTAHELFEARQAVSRLEAQSIANEQSVSAARFAMIDANGALVGLQRSFQRSILSNPQYLAARAQLEAARDAIAASR
jgi:hypothetical protein